MRKTLLRATMIAGTSILGVAAAYAAPMSEGDLPILVDKYYAIKDPIGPVSQAPVTFEKGPLLKIKPQQLDPRIVTKQKRPGL